MNKKFDFKADDFNPSRLTWEVSAELEARWMIKPPSTTDEMITIQALDEYFACITQIATWMLRARTCLPHIHDRKCLDHRDSDLYCEAIVEFGLPQTILESLESSHQSMERNRKEMGDKNTDAHQEALIAGAATFLRRHGYHVIKSEAPTQG